MSMITTRCKLSDPQVGVSVVITAAAWLCPADPQLVSLSLLRLYCVMATRGVKLDLS